VPLWDIVLDNAAHQLNKPSPYKKFVILLLGLYSLLQIYCINQLTPNYDEPSFAGYGITLLKLQREKDVLLYESKLPVTALNMVPRSVEQLLNPGLVKTWEESVSDIINGRYVSLLVSLLLGLLIFRWSRELYGERTALFTLIFYLICPNFLAHGIFVSSDIFACFFLTASFYFLWRFNKDRKWRSFAWMSVATGMAQVSKFSMVHLFLIIPLLLLAVYLNRRKQEGPAHQFKFWKTALYAGSFLLINWFIICGAHLFYQVFLPLNEYSFMSASFQSVQRMFSGVVPNIPVPLPSSYVRSMDAVIYFDKLGGGVPGAINGEPYILGHSSRYGFWYYYFVSIFYKVPIPALILWIGSVFLVFRRFNKNSFFTNGIFLLLPSFYFIVYLDLFYSTQLGIRHIMIIFPLLFVLSGKFISTLLDSGKKTWLYVMVAYQAVSVSLYFPHFLPYTNEFILNKKLAYKKIADTNLCYGEGGKYLHAWMEKNKDAVYMPERPTKGKVVMEINEMLNLNIRTMHKYDWVRPLKPVGHIHSQYLIFITD
jgi:hypothetical protein